MDELKKLLSQNGYPRGVVNYNMNDVLQKQQNKPLTPTITVPKKKMFLVLPYLGLQSKIAHKQIMSCINKFYGCIDLRVIFLFFLTKIDLAVAKWLRLYIKLPVGTAMIFISEKQKEDCMTEK